MQVTLFDPETGEAMRLSLTAAKRIVREARAEANAKEDQREAREARKRQRESERIKYDFAVLGLAASPLIMLELYTSMTELLAMGVL